MAGASAWEARDIADLLALPCPSRKRNERALDSAAWTPSVNARQFGAALKPHDRPQAPTGMEATVMANIGNQVSAFVHDLVGTNPGPPNEPPGPTISAFVDTLVPPSPIRPPETPPNPIVPGALISDFVHELGLNPGPPNEPPGPEISAFVLELVGTSPGPPNLLLI
jgi:hypothetical protein